MRMRDLIALSICPSIVACHGTDENPSLPSGPCTEDVALAAFADSTDTSSGVRVFGASSAPAGVTVRAVHVAGEPVPLSAFNYRGWQVDLSQSLLQALAVDGIASLSVIAFTNTGCEALSETSEPKVRVVQTDASAEPNAE